jgi:hypothetical protein
MQWSDEGLYSELLEAINFDDDEPKAIKLTKKGLEHNKLNVNQADEEGTSLLSHAEAACMDDLQQLLKENGALSD